MTTMTEVAAQLDVLAAAMADAVDGGDEVTARRLLHAVEAAADSPGTEEATPLVVLARRFAAAHRRALARAGCYPQTVADQLMLSSSMPSGRTASVTFVSPVAIAMV